MNSITTTGIVLTRTDYGEADRILTVLTPDRGKLRLMAKGVRKIKSKLAGGIELFSISQLSYIPGRGDIDTLISSRLETHWGKIIDDLTRTMLGYELLKRIHRATEDEPGEEYYTLLVSAFEALNTGLNETVLELWYDAQLLKLAGHQPNLKTDTTKQRLVEDKLYTFDFEAMAFAQTEQGLLTPAHIKYLRLVFGLDEPTHLSQVKDAQKVLGPCFQLVSTIRKQYIR